MPPLPYLTSRELAHELLVRPSSLPGIAKRLAIPHRGGLSRFLYPLSVLEDFWMSSPHPKHRAGLRCVRRLPFPANTLLSLRGLEWRRLLADRSLPLLPLYRTERPGAFPEIRYNPEEISQWQAQLNPSQSRILSTYLTR